jgi:uncharacterized membrane protein YeiH
MDTESVFAALNIFGLFVFAVSGALTALRNDLDILSVVMTAFVTGVGGGTIRDVLLGEFPVWWIRDTTAVTICLAGAFAGMVAQPIFVSRLKALIWADALGLAVFSILGTQAALAADAPLLIAIFMGAVSATFGGLIRDVLLNEPSLFLKSNVNSPSRAPIAVTYSNCSRVLKRFLPSASWNALDSFSLFMSTALFPTMPHSSYSVSLSVVTY